MPLPDKPLLHSAPVLCLPASLRSYRPCLQRMRLLASCCAFLTAPPCLRPSLPCLACLCSGSWDCTIRVWHRQILQCLQLVQAGALTV